MDWWFDARLLLPACQSAHVNMSLAVYGHELQTDTGSERVRSSSFTCERTQQETVRVLRVEKQQDPFPERSGEGVAHPGGALTRSPPITWRSSCCTLKRAQSDTFQIWLGRSARRSPVKCLEQHGAETSAFSHTARFRKCLKATLLYSLVSLNAFPFMRSVCLFEPGLLCHRVFAGHLGCVVLVENPGLRYFFHPPSQTQSIPLNQKTKQHYITLHEESRSSAMHWEVGVSSIRQLICDQGISSPL